MRFDWASRVAALQQATHVWSFSVSRKQRDRRRKGVELMLDKVNVKLVPLAVAKRQHKRAADSSTSSGC